MSDVSLSVPGDVLYRAVNSVIHAAARDAVRPQLYSVWIESHAEHFRAVACDSFRLALCTLAPIGGPIVDLFLPLKIARELVRTQKVRKHSVILDQFGSVVTCSYGTVNLDDHAYLGDPVPYQRILDISACLDAWCVVSTDWLRDAARWAWNVDKKASTPRITLAMSDGTVQATAPGMDISTDAETQGSDVLVLDARYLYEAVLVVTTTTVKLAYHLDSISIMQIVGVGDDVLLNAIMPLAAGPRWERLRALMAQQKEAS